MQFLMKLVGCVVVVIAIANGLSKCSESSESASAVTKATPAPSIDELDNIDAFNDQESDEMDVSADESDKCYTGVSPKLRSLIDEIHACDLENALGNHDSSALKIIPVRGYRDGVAGVFKKYRLHVNQNVDVTCQDQPWADTGSAGCMVGIYVSRIRASNKYSDLAGWTAVWFRGVNDTSFRPVSPFAEHISKANDSILRIGGLMDVSDRP